MKQETGSSGGDPPDAVDIRSAILPRALTEDIEEGLKEVGKPSSVARTAVRRIRDMPDRWWLFVSVLVALLVLLPDLNQGWFPHDEGVLGQSAERVLAGEVPHRDFDEIYTGLLTYLHAATFRILGVKADHLRYPLALASLVWLVVSYRILLRFVPPYSAAAISCLILLWSVPNYPAPMPSWYNLFLATGGVLALMRWAESGHGRWLFVAGVLGGISFLVKLTGVFFIAGAVLGVIAAEVAEPSSKRVANGTVALRVMVVSTGIAICAGLIFAVGTDVNSLVRFVLPPASLLVGLSAVAFRDESRRHGPSVGEILRRLLPLMLGALLPVLAAIVLMAMAGGLAPAIDGVLVRPFRRTGFAALSPPSPVQMLGALPLAWMLWPRALRQSDSRLVAHVLVGTALLMVLALARIDSTIYRVVWGAAWSLPLVVGVVGGLLLVRNRWQTVTPQRPAARMLLPILMVASFAVLVEFPFAAPIYSLYALPLAIFALVALIQSRPGLRPAFGVLVICFFMAFGWLHLRPGNARNLGGSYHTADDTVAVGLARAELRVSKLEADVYRGLIGLLDSLSEGRVLWAGPDAPEVYFLSGIRNTTRTMFDFLDREPVWGNSILRELQARGVSLVALKLEEGFSPPPTPTTVGTIQDAYPHRRVIAGWLVLWR